MLGAGASTSFTISPAGGVQFWAAVATIVAAALAGGGLLGRSGLRAWRAASKAYHDDIRATVATQLLPLVAELSPNHGNSMKDHVSAGMEKLDGLAQSVEALTAAFDGHQAAFQAHRVEFQTHVDADEKVAGRLEKVAGQVQQLTDLEERRRPGGLP